MATTVRCPECQRKNQIPAGATGKARCGACGARLLAPRGRSLDVAGPPGGAGGTGGASPPGLGGAGSPWGPGGPPGPASPWGPAGPAGGGGPWFGGGDATGARMRQTRRTPRVPSTRAGRPGASGFGDPSDRPGDPRAALVRRWDDLLRLAPADLGLTAAIDQSGIRDASDPIAWLSSAAGVPRAALDQVRHLRNRVASNQPVPDREIADALETLDRAIGTLGRTRLPE